MNGRSPDSATKLRCALSGALACLFAILGSAPARGTARLESATEYEVKAAFLFNFAKYTTWPDGVFPNAQSPFIIGVLGPDPFGSVLDDTFKDKQVAGRKIVVVRFSRLEDVTSPHLLFVSASSRDDVADIAKVLGTRPILLVGEKDRFAERGGIANFYLERSKVHFEVNVGLAKKCRLQISAQLLKLARIVGDEQQTP